MEPLLWIQVILSMDLQIRLVHIITHLCSPCHYKELSASTGYLVDMKMYKFPDFRCLKPKPGLPSSKWPHYEMVQHRAAKSVKELQKVPEIPFDKESSINLFQSSSKLSNHTKSIIPSFLRFEDLKISQYFFNFEDPDVWNDFTDKKKGI